ncbi:MAG TPA: hypothetical protein VIM41_14130 [Gammaproteobacteria bacterium]
MFDKTQCIELRVLGPEGKPYIELENEFKNEFSQEGVSFLVPRLFSAPEKTSVALVIGIAILSGSCTHLINKVIDKIFEIGQEQNQKNTTIEINVYDGNNYISISGDKEKVKKEVENFSSKLAIEEKEK